MRHKLCKQIFNLSTLLPLLAAGAAWAQGDGQDTGGIKLPDLPPGTGGGQVQPPPQELPYTALLTDIHILGWWVLFLVIWWLVAVAITAAFSKNNYPPHIAAIACWVGVSGWLITFFVFVIKRLMHHEIEKLVWLLVFAVILVLLVITVAKNSTNKP